jgi:HK97 family phage portal protein
MEQKSEIRILGLKVFEKRSDLAHTAIRENFLNNIFGSQTATGRRVNTGNANAVSAYWACRQLLSNSFAMVPLNAYVKKGDSRTILDTDPIHYLIHKRPNSYMTSFTWRRTIMMQATDQGNSYTLIHRNDYSGKVESLELIQDPREVTPYLIKGKVWYSIRNVNEPIPASEIIHFKWNGDGIVGKSPLEIARENIGQALAIQDYGSKIFATGGSKKVALKVPNKMNDEQKEGFRKFWDKKHGGVENLHELAFLDGGADLVEVGMNPEEAQMVEIMKFKIEEICRIFGVPLHLVQSLDHATNNNIEHQGIQYVIYSMMPHFVNMEQELDFKLFEDDPNKYTRHNTNALMRGDMKTEAEYFGKMTDIGVYSINDIRRIKDENPIDNGDEHYVQVNRTTIENLNEQVTPSVDGAIRQLVEETIKNKNGHKVETN